MARKSSFCEVRDHSSNWYGGGRSWEVKDDAAVNKVIQSNSELPQYIYKYNQVESLSITATVTEPANEQRMREILLQIDWYTTSDQ